ncbi:ARF GTPase-activating protein GIT1-like [Artemia franciscana]|uniref:Arf-GAP domain-containing protein n=1 Tax=Artemia franciscana TaxID=6661 RepID=A0AA88LCR8_ARTSF|nr:hypothetical protein QYM36_000216 [Artemia franciscana]
MDTLLKKGECGECSSKQMRWVSMNKFLLLCDDCASVHLEMGRHVSYIRPVSGIFNQDEIRLLSCLVSVSNSIWEHRLLDPANIKNAKKKPVATDPIYPVKAEFIRAKHIHNAFIFKYSTTAASNEDDDFSEQLHGCVRTANFETTLRLLICGAEPNYFHLEKGVSTVHVAVENNQSAQVYLLYLYGTDLNSLDSKGRAPLDIAQELRNNDMMERLIELQHMVSDRISKFLCGKVPNHKEGLHYLIPKIDPSLAFSSMNGVSRIQNLTNELFEELVMDLYDELDRRDIERAWNNIQTLEKSDLPFPVAYLTPIIAYSGSRNEIRRRLSKLNPTEFAILLVDTLKEIKRRNDILISCEEEHVYDRVASEDYFPIDLMTPHFYSEPHDTLSSGLIGSKGLTPDTTRHIQEQLAASDVKMEARWKSVEQQIKDLKETVETLLKEKSAFKKNILVEKLPPLYPKINERAVGSPELLYSKPIDEVLAVAHRSRSNRPISMFEPRKSSTQPLPSATEVSKLASAITSSVKELKKLVDSGQVLELSSAAEKVVGAALAVLGTLNNSAQDHTLQVSLNKLSQSLSNLQSTCKDVTANQSKYECSYITQKVYPCAHDVLCAVKTIMNFFQSHC